MIGATVRIAFGLALYAVMGALLLLELAWQRVCDEWEALA